MQDASTPSPTPAGPLPGFYPDPNDATKMRRWDGSAWTDEHQERPPESPAVPPAAPVVPTAAPTPSEDIPATVPLGYLAAFFLPIVGLVLGIVALYSRNPKARPHGVAIIMISIVVAVVAGILIANAMSDPSSSVDCVTFPEYC